MLWQIFLIDKIYTNMKVYHPSLETEKIISSESIFTV